MAKGQHNKLGITGILEAASTLQPGDAAAEAQLRADAAMLLDGLIVDRDDAVRAGRSANARVGTAAAASPWQHAAGQRAAMLSESTPAPGPYTGVLICPCLYTSAATALIAGLAVVDEGGRGRSIIATIFQEQSGFSSARCNTMP